MRLYVVCRSCGQKVYLNLNVSRRSELPSVFEVRCPNCGVTDTYTPNDVEVEAAPALGIPSAVVGGLLGLLGGPLGLILGGLAGGVFGANADADEQRRVQQFRQE